MAHFRTAIRNKLELLLNGVPALGANVYRERPTAIRGEFMPCAVVSISMDNAENLSLGPVRAQERTVTARVTLFVKGITGWDIALDDLCESVEKVIGADPTLGGTAKVSDLAYTDIRYEQMGDGVYGTAELVYNARVVVLENAPDVLL